MCLVRLVRSHLRGISIIFQLKHTFAHNGIINSEETTCRTGAFLSFLCSSATKQWQLQGYLENTFRVWTRETSEVHRVEILQVRVVQLSFLLLP